MKKLLETRFEMLDGLEEPTTIYQVMVYNKVAEEHIDQQMAWNRALELDTSEEGDYPITSVKTISQVAGGLCFFVLPSKKDELVKRFESLKKRATKNEKPAPSYKTVGTRTCRFEVKDPWGYTRETKETREIIRVEVADVTLNGWAFVATLDRVGSGNVIRKSPRFSEEIPEEFRTRHLCDHCKTNRPRNSTYLFRHEDGQWMQTGTNCAKDVFGSDCGAEVAYWASYEDSIVRGEGDFADEGFGGRGVSAFSLDIFMVTVGVLIKGFGWTPRSQSEHAFPTADMAWSLLANPQSKTVKELKADLMTALGKRGVDEKEIREQLGEEVEACIKWVADLQPNNDYLWNLQVSCGAGYVNGRSSGIIASALSAYYRAIEKEMERRNAPQKVSEYIAPVGAKLGRKGKDSLPPIKVTVLYTREFSSDYGVKTLVTMQDEGGRIAKWWASGGIEAKAGETYFLRGTVKAHGEFKQVKETTFTRCELEQT